jgi:sulfur-oxidizing protein SoxZ
MATFPTRIVLPSTAKKGEVIEIKTLIQHIMETGYRRDDVGKPVPRDIINSFVVTYGNTEIFRTDLYPGVAANPYFAFSTIATETGELVFTWSDDKGNVTTERRKITVT